MTTHPSDFPIVLLTSTQSRNSQFGTGFVYRLEQDTTYIITCAHVIRDLGGGASVLVEGLPATVIATGEELGVDLAIITVEHLSYNTVLPLRFSGSEGATGHIIGFQAFNSQYLARPLRVTLVKRVELAPKGQSGRIKAWDITIEDGYYIKPGYSGSPVIDDVTGSVVGVASHALSEGKQAFAIAIENIARLDVPFVPPIIVSIPASQSIETAITATLPLIAPNAIADKDVIQEITSFEPTITGTQKALIQEQSISVTNPLLIGVLADVSAPMLRVLTTTSRRTGLSRNNVGDSVNSLIGEILRFCSISHGNDILPKIALFAYAYGFGETLRDILSFAHTVGLTSIDPEQVPSSSIRDIFESVTKQQHTSSTLTALDISDNWKLFEQSIAEQTLDMAGGPPQLGNGAQLVYQRFSEELQKPYYKNPFLFVISSGFVGNEQINAITETMRLIKGLDVQIVTCYIGPKNIVEPRRLYAAAKKNWPPEAILLHQCASRLTTTSPRSQALIAYAQARGWSVPNEAALFIQINQTTILKEFTQILLNSR